MKHIFLLLVISFSSLTESICQNMGVVYEDASGHISAQVATDATMAGNGTTASPLGVDSAVVSTRHYVDSALSRHKKYEYFNDFIVHVNADVVGRDMFASNSGSGAGTNGSLPSPRGNVIGVAQSSTGTTATGRAMVTTNINILRFGGGSWVYECQIDTLPTLCDATQTYQLLLGFLDTNTDPNQQDGAYFLYDSTGVSTGISDSPDKWITVTASNGSRTFNTTTVPVAIGPTNLKIVVNAAGTSVNFYINGVHTGVTHTTNIPNAAGREFGFAWLLKKSAGTTPRTVGIDYLYVRNDFTTPKTVY